MPPPCTWIIEIAREAKCRKDPLLDCDSGSILTSDFSMAPN
jgi:hypothetical protein